jgi:hypothetical protein
MHSLCAAGRAANLNYAACPPACLPVCLQEVEGVTKHLIPLAARLLWLEQGVPSEAVATGVTQEQWDEFE